MDTADFIDALELEDQLVFDENIDSIATVQTDTFVLDRQRMFELEADSIQRELPGKALLIGRFEQPRAKDPMNFDRTANDSIRKLAELPLRALHVLHGRPSVGFFSTDARYPQICRTPEREGHKITRALFERNIAGKLGDPEFTADIGPLLAAGFAWDIGTAAPMVSTRLIELLPGDPWKGGA